MIEILFLLIILVVLIVKFNSVLGKEVGNLDNKDYSNFVKNMEKKLEEKINKQIKNTENEIIDAQYNEISSNFANEIEKIKQHYSYFDLGKFIQITNKIFEKTINAYANGDLETLKENLGPKTFETFKNSIENRKQNVEYIDKLEFLIKSNVVDVVVNDEFCSICIEFVSDRIKCSKDSEGHVLTGHPFDIVRCNDTWTFKKYHNVENNNWPIVMTK